MKSFIDWIKNLFEGMTLAFVHPLKNAVPPEIGTHSYRHKPHKGKRNLRYN